MNKKPPQIQIIKVEREPKVLTTGKYFKNY